MQVMVNRLLSLIVLTLAATFVTGCQTDRPRVVLVPPIVTNPDTMEPSDIIRVGPGVRGRIYIPTETGWELSDNEIDYAEGWFMIPPPSKGEAK